jgi:hypothetical protein
MEATPKYLKAYNKISELWEKAGLDFDVTMLEFQPPKDSSLEALETYAAFKGIAVFRLKARLSLNLSRKTKI